MPPAIRCDHLAKRFEITASGGHITGYRTLREGLLRPLKAPLRWLRGGEPAGTKRFHAALDDVSFEIPRGEAVGIIGRNGAGKSTLLKILSRVTKPTSGEALIWGHVGSLLEVGTSFHPELTGRENIYLNAAVLGMRRPEIRRKFDEIVEFAEIDTFLDTPVKRYSSGMFIRLAFSVAAHLEPEVLLIDEVLAVGDAKFQKKCLGRMGTGAREGRTVLFVSHNMAALQSLCSRAIWIDKGRVVQDGPVSEVAAAYLRTSFAPETERVWDDPATAPGNDRVRVRRACVRPKAGSAKDAITVRSPVAVELEWWNQRDRQIISPFIKVCDQHGIVAFASSPIREPEWHGKPMPLGLFRSTCEIPGDLLNDGSYHLQLEFRLNEGMIVFSDDSLLTMEVVDDVSARGSQHCAWPGTVRPQLAWTTEKLDSAASRT